MTGTDIEIWEGLPLGERLQALREHVRGPVYRGLMQLSKGRWGAAFGDPRDMADDVLSEIAVDLLDKQQMWTGLTRDEAGAVAYGFARTALLQQRNVAASRLRALQVETEVAANVEWGETSTSGTPTLTITDILGTDISSGTIKAVARARRVVTEREGADAWDRMCRQVLRTPPAEIQRLFDTTERNDNLLTEALVALLGVPVANAPAQTGARQPRLRRREQMARTEAWVAERISTGQRLTIEAAREAGIGRGPKSTGSMVLAAWVAHEVCARRQVTVEAIVESGLVDHVGATTRRTAALARELAAQDLLISVPMTLRDRYPELALDDLDLTIDPEQEEADAAEEAAAAEAPHDGSHTVTNPPDDVADPEGWRDALPAQSLWAPSEPRSRTTEGSVGQVPDDALLALVGWQALEENPNDLRVRYSRRGEVLTSVSAPPPTARGSPWR